ncbi:MAG: glycosyltransferase family 2 protein, partial [Sphingopyxis terrae]
SSAAAVTACIVSFNSAPLLRDCLEAFVAQDGVETHAIVHDNASADDSIAIAEATPRTRVLKSSRNVGFAAGANTAAALAVTPFVLFLNPDAILAPGALRRLVESLAEAPPFVAGVQPKLIFPGRTERGSRLIDSTGIELSLKNLSPVDRGAGTPDEGQFDGQTHIFGPTGACALWRRDVLEKLTVEGQIHDERLFAYYEDVDLAWRANELGYRFLFVPEALATHARKNPPHHGPSVDARAFANRYLILVKNAPLGILWGTFLKTLPYEALRWAYKSLTQKRFIEAWYQLFENLPAALRQRREIRRRAREAARFPRA